MFVPKEYIKLKKMFKLYQRTSFYIAAFIFGGLFNSAAQAKKPLQDITDRMHTDSAALLNEFGKNKKMPAGFEKQILYALSYFPELANTKITIKLKKGANGIISTRPSFSSIFRRSSKRSYIVIINDSSAGRILPVFSNGGVNGQVGILGHEFSHIVYFSKRTGFALVGLGIAHISDRFMDRFENKTDSVTIERGLGYQLIDWKQYLDKGFRAMRPVMPTPSEKPAIRERYMSVEHIRKVMANSELYRK